MTENQDRLQDKKMGKVNEANIFKEFHSKKKKNGKRKKELLPDG